MDRIEKTKILVIGDNKEFLTVLSNLFRNEPISTTTISKNVSAIELALTNKYQLILIDSGDSRKQALFEGIAFFKESGCRTPIIIIPDNFNTEDEIQAYRVGVNILHKKPINPPLLLAQVNKLLNDNLLRTEIQMDDIFLKPREGKILRSGREISLTCREYRFLLLLIKHNGSILTRNHIISNIFNYNNDVSQCAVDTMVSRIRMKLGRNKKEVIETITGKGYRLGSTYAEKRTILYQ